MPAPRSTTSCASMPRAGRTRSRSSIRPTARRSPTANRASSPMRRSIAWSRRSRSACATSDCRRTSIVATQFPNTSESVLALLGIMRAGMIAAPMPMLWRRADCVAALSRIGTKALMTCARVGTTDHAALAMQVAAAIFTVRCVCGFGPMPDGRAVRRSVRTGRGRRGRFVRGRSPRQSGLAYRGDYIRYDVGRHRAGRAQSRRIAGGRIADARGKPSRAGFAHRVVDARGLLRRHCTDIGAVAAVRRNAATASAVRCHGLVRAIEGTVLRSRDPARIAGRAARGSGDLRAAAPPEKYSGLLARARAACRSRRPGRCRM